MSVPLPSPLPREPADTLESRAYAVYLTDFGKGVPSVCFQDWEVHANRNPHAANPQREHSYWHSVTYGQPESARTTPDLNRLVRVPWIRPIVGGWQHLRVWWEHEVRGGGRIHWTIWHVAQRHVIIVKELKSSYLLVTSFPTDGDISRWHRRFNDAQKTGRALQKQDAP